VFTVRFKVKSEIPNLSSIGLIVERLSLIFHFSLGFAHLGAL